MMLKLFAVLLLVVQAMGSYAREIRIETRNTVLIFTADKQKKLYQAYFGEKIAGREMASYGVSHEAYVTSGTNNLFEPAIRMVHADGNPSLELLYTGDTREQKNDGSTLYKINLQDPQYPVTVTLNFQAFADEDVILSWMEVTHRENGPITLTNFASSMLHFDARQYWLTQFNAISPGREATIEENRLPTGITIIDSKLGTRAHEYVTPGFYLSLNGPSSETTGKVIAGTLAWTGNFQFLFEVDNTRSLRVISGMNPFASEYHLEKERLFATPKMIITYSSEGKGKATRSLHRWAEAYGVHPAGQPGMTLLNNWETTTFNFDAVRIDSMLSDTKKLGAGLFLLDDGWFGNKYPRVNDKAGLGDWQVNKTRFPDGLAPLLKSAENKGVKFGIWIEPEMVNPKSALYESHPDWILKLPNRAEDYQRNQLVLDLANPRVQDFVYQTLDQLLTQNPGIALVKWDCNRRMTNAWSPYLKNQQSHLQIDYNNGLYRVLDRIRLKYPNLPMMLCSAGGGRTDYGSLYYFNEFWPSDDTNPFERVYIQWGYSYFFPAFTSANHVTSMGKQPIKYRTDVALMGRLGYDLDVGKMSAQDLKFSQSAIQLYNHISQVTRKGDLYRLVSPYEENRAVLLYTDREKSRAILFAYNLNVRYRETFNKVPLQGLDPVKKYKVTEVNLLPGTLSAFAGNGQVFTGDQLMKAGLEVSSNVSLTSAVFELTEEP